MANSNAAAAEVASAPAIEVTLEEFCVRLSLSVKKPELLGGFHHTEKAAGHVKDTEANYKSRFAVYVNKPV